MKILATTGDVKTRSSEDANGILEIFFYLFGLKKTFYGIKRVPFVSLYGSFGSFISANFSARKTHRSNNYCFIKVYTSRGKQQLFYLIYFFSDSTRKPMSDFPKRNVTLYLEISNLCDLFYKMNSHLRTYPSCMFCSSVFRVSKMQKPSSARSEFIVGGKYKLLRKIGSGSFGDIYQGINITNGEVCIEQYHGVPISCQLFCLVIFNFSKLWPSIIERTLYYNDINCAQGI